MSWKIGETTTFNPLFERFLLQCVNYLLGTVLVISDNTKVLTRNFYKMNIFGRGRVKVQSDGKDFL